jgi:hypothetical protein
MLAHGSVSLLGTEVRCQPVWTSAWGIQVQGAASSSAHFGDRAQTDRWRRASGYQSKSMPAKEHPRHSSSVRVKLHDIDMQLEALKQKKRRDH